MEYLIKHPILIPILTFIAVAVYLIYVEFRKLDDNNNRNDNDSDGGIPYEGPDLDLPPGVTLSREQEELVA